MSITLETLSCARQTRAARPSRLRAAVVAAARPTDPAARSWLARAADYVELTKPKIA